MGPYTEDQEKRINRELQQYLSPYYLVKRSSGESTFHTLTFSAIQQLANDIFGYKQWRQEDRDYIEEHRSKQGSEFTVLVSCIVRVTIVDGTFREDVGYASVSNTDEQEAITCARKYARNAAFRRAIRLFGNALGNCLHPEYLKYLAACET